MAWHYNGIIADSTVYSNGNPTGTSLAFYPSGRIKDSVFYRADGSGIRYTWYNNGSLPSAGVLAPDGKKTGRWKYWHDNGKLTDVYVSNSAFPEFEKLALRAIRQSPRWEPAISHNRRMPDHFRQPVVFSQLPGSN